MKVIFLDVDGVLNTSETFDRRARFGYLSDVEIDLFRLEYLKEIVERTGAKVVLTSAFRRYFNKKDGEVLPTFPKGVKLYSILLEHDIILFDITPINNGSKEDQIKEWLLNNDVDNFVIFDDDPSVFYDFRKNLIQTSRPGRNSLLYRMDDATGLCKEHVYYSIDMLNKKDKVKQMVLSR